MLKPKVQKALNEQINAELYSSYLYLSMAAYFEDTDLPGFAGWFKAQALEELVHVEKFYGYINEKSGRVKLSAIDGPPTEWKSALDAVTVAHEHEHKVSDLIHKLVDLAQKEGDRATENFLQWFVAEQVEEEKSTWDIVRNVKMAGDGLGTFMLDREMAARVFTAPPAGGTAE
jgi:ferritin